MYSRHKEGKELNAFYKKHAQDLNENPEFAQVS